MVMAAAVTIAGCGNTEAKQKEIRDRVAAEMAEKARLDHEIDDGRSPEVSRETVRLHLLRIKHLREGVKEKLPRKE